MRMSVRSTRLLLSAVLVLPAAAAMADPLYTVTLMGGSGSTASDINRWGDVVGSVTSGDVSHAFVNAGGTYTDLGTLGGTNSYANGINDNGQVVGTAQNGALASHAFLYAGGSMNDLGTLGGTGSAAYAINNHGVVVGYAQNADPASQGFPHAFSYAGGTMNDLGTLPGGLGSYAYAINNGGLVGGASHQGEFTVPEYPSYAVTFNGGAVDRIGAPELGNSSIQGLNDAGAAVGGIPTSGLPHGSHAFIYDHGTITDLGLLEPGQDDSIAWDINNHGQVVGAAAVTIDPEHYGYHGFLWTGGALVDLNTLVDPASGWVITDASGINDAQQIAATACYGGVTGDCRAVRLDLVPAVPEPGAWAMLGLGLGLVGAWKRARPAPGTGARMA